MTVVCVRRENRVVDRPSERMPCDHEVRDWSDAATSPAAARIWKQPGRILPYSLQREHGPPDTLISDIQLPEL